MYEQKRYFTGDRGEREDRKKGGERKDRKKGGERKPIHHSLGKGEPR